MLPWGKGGGTAGRGERHAPADRTGPEERRRENKIKIGSVNAENAGNMTAPGFL